MQQKIKNPNKGVAITDVETKRISLSHKGIGMYAITFKVGSKKYSQTRHMTEAQADGYEPTIKVVQSGGRTLQASSFTISNNGKV